MCVCVPLSITMMLYASVVAAALLCVCSSAVVRPQFIVKVVFSDTNVANLTDIAPTFTTPAVELFAESGASSCQPHVRVRTFVMRSWATTLQIAAVAKPVCAQVPTEAFANDQYRYEYMCVSLVSCG